MDPFSLSKSPLPITGCWNFYTGQYVWTEVHSRVISRCYSIPRFKQRFSFITPEYGNLYALLDAAKVADTLLLVPSTEHGIDDFGDYCLSCLFAQGLPSSIFVTKVCWRKWTVGPAYKEFVYIEHSAATNIFLYIEIIDKNVQLKRATTYKEQCFGIF